MNNQAELTTPPQYYRSLVCPGAPRKRQPPSRPLIFMRQPPRVEDTMDISIETDQDRYQDPMDADLEYIGSDTETIILSENDEN